MSYSHLSVGIYTLGCKVNQYESEAIAEAFAAYGMKILPPSARCDVYVINTCTVTAESDRKARQFIRRAIHHNPNAFVLVTGCFSQTNPNAVSAIEGVDYVCGNNNKLSVVSAALALIEAGKKPNTPTVVCSAPDASGFEAMHITRFDRTRAYVKIEDGCESHCTYCIIPDARGKIRSKDPEDVIREVRELTENGCREIVLTGIETASYGKDLADTDLADLLYRIDQIPNIGRIRLGSLDPSLMKQSFVDRIASLRSLAPHFHLSMQSGSDNILALMKRKYNTRIAREGMERLRRAIPNVSFTTDMIVGFPHEEESDFQKTLQFVEDAGFLMIHVFPYSRRQGTLAAAMSGQIAESIKHERVAILSSKAATIRSSILDSMIDTEVEVLFESYANGIAKGHTPNFVEVACPIHTPCQAETAIVRIERHDGNLCYGSLVDNSLKESYRNEQ